MTGIIDVGGGMRDIYGAGVLDYCLDNAIVFDLCIGVSAGSANLVSYLAGQRGRTYHFYAEYAARKEYMSFSKLFSKGYYFDLEYIYSYLSDENGENPLDFNSFSKSKADFITVVTDAKTAKELGFSGKASISPRHIEVINNIENFIFLHLLNNSYGIDSVLFDYFSLTLFIKMISCILFYIGIFILTNTKKEDIDKNC